MPNVNTPVALLEIYGAGDLLYDWIEFCFLIGSI